MAAESNGGGGNPNAAAASSAETAYKPRYIDIGINLADPIFRGIYHGTQRHPDDLSAVISRAREVGCQKLIVTGSDLQSSRDALEIAKEYPGTVYTTAGIHPCSSAIFGAARPRAHRVDGHTAPCEPNPDLDPSHPLPPEDDDGDEPDAARTASIISELEALIASARSPSHSDKSKSPLVALGEFGLDYDRLHYCPRRLQLASFGAQLDLALRLDPPLPLFLHSRAAHADFVSLLKQKLGGELGRLRRGAVVHSFTGTAAELRELLDLGLHVGVNGCSLKTAGNCEVVRDVVGLDRLMLETDGPWCEMRPSHEGWRFLAEAAKREATATAAAAAAAVGPEPGPESTNTGGAAALATSGASSAPAFTTAPSETPSGTSTPASASASASASGTATPNPTATTTTATPIQRPQQQQRSKKKQPPPPKPKKKEPEVPERFPAVKKERWTEGAMVKSRNEPCMIERVAVAVAGIKGVSAEELCEAAWRNTVGVFDLGDGEEDRR